MGGLILAVVLCGQAPEFVKGYQPQVGDRVVLREMSREDGCRS